MKVLLVGAGAVGTVLGYHLARGGAEVGFLVRPAHLPELEGGIAIYPVGWRGLPAEPVLFTDFEPRTSAGPGPWDLVLLCTSSPALRRGGWLEELAASVGDAAFAAINDGIDDYAFVTARVPAERVIWGMFGLTSWIAEPEIDRVPRRGIAFWRPPLTSIPWSGPRARALAEALSRGGLPSVVHPDVQRELAFAGPLLEVHTVALECAGYSFRALRSDPALVGEAHQALKELGALGIARHGGRLPMIYRLLRPWMSRAALSLAPRLLPLDIESFFRRHYTKVSEQTLEALRRQRAEVESRGLPSEGLGRLLGRLEARRGIDPRGSGA